MSGLHGFQVTGDPADLPPGAKMIELNISEHVETAARALHGELKREKDPEWEEVPAIEKHHWMELGMAMIMALVEKGWHPPGLHELIQDATGEDAPKTGLDPR